LKPEFWSSEDVVSLSHEGRLLMVGLMSFADDDGRFIANRQAICGYVYPSEEIPVSKFARWFAECCQNMVVVYGEGRVKYGCIPSWHHHQKINRYTKSKLPPPPDSIQCWPRSTPPGDGQ